MTMTAQDLSNLKAQANGTINRGGEFTFTGPAGHVAKIGYVAGGGFCRAELRTPAGRLLLTRTAQWTHQALAVFVQLANIAALAPPPAAN